MEHFGSADIGSRETILIQAIASEKGAGLAPNHNTAKLNKNNDHVEFDCSLSLFELDNETFPCLIVLL